MNEDLRVGDRIRILDMPVEDKVPEPDDLGTVLWINKYEIAVRFDSRRLIQLIRGVDVWERVPWPPPTTRRDR